jgi:hypothetical protein
MPDCGALEVRMGQARYWLSFDLGLRGNYEGLYEWLDRLGAKECGDSVATFRSDKTREQLTAELTSLLGSEKKTRLYLISLARGGKFVLGKRKAPPWAGYSPDPVEAEEEK